MNKDGQTDGWTQGKTDVWTDGQTFFCGKINKIQIIN